jgi:hypothetical protein
MVTKARTVPLIIASIVLIALVCFLVTLAMRSGAATIVRAPSDVVGNLRQPTSMADNWKMYTTLIDWFGTVTLQYPSDWTLTSLHQGGHPNFAKLAGSDGESCVEISIGTNFNADFPHGNDALIDLDAFTAALAEVNHVRIPHSVTNTPVTEVDSTQKVERSVVVGGKPFMVGVAYLGIDQRLGGGRVYADLSSCGMGEAVVFTAVLKSLSASQKAALR